MSGTDPIGGTEVEPEIVVEVVDDTAPDDRNKPLAPESTDDDADISLRDGEVDQYRRKVQTRLKELTAKAHAERRTKEAAVREREEAVRFATQVGEENKRLRELARNNEALAIEQAQARTKVQVAAAQRAAREAMEAGDTEKIVEAQSALSRALSEEDRTSRYQPAPAPPPIEAPRQQTQIPAPDEQAASWAEKNTWFGQDKRMTAFAYGLHEELVAEGVDPTSATYYKRIDQEMRSTFPTRFRDAEGQAAPPSRSSVVAPATRSQRTPRTVQLTASQVTVAHRLGLTREQYAAQIVKEAQENG